MSHLGEKDFYDREVVLAAQRERIQKGIYGGLSDANDIQKGGGEGSKGGKVTGHTKSGKPIYEQHKHESHRSFSVEDHKDAIKLHRELAQKHFDVVNKTTSSSVKKKNNDSAYGHNEQANRHEREVNKKEKEAQHKVGDKVKASEKPVYDNHGDMAEFHEGQVKYANEKQVKFHEKLKQHHEYGRSLTAKEHEAAAKYHEEISDSDKEVAKDEGVEYEKTIHDDVVDYHKAYAKYLKEKESKGNVEKAMTAAGGEHVTSKESVEHGPKDMQNPKPSDLAKAFEILGLDEDICKAEGVRGGKIVGHTKSGKPIYANANHEAHREFASSEHKEAIDFHEAKMKTDKGNEISHYNQIDRHKDLAKMKTGSESKHKEPSSQDFKAETERYKAEVEKFAGISHKAAEVGDKEKANKAMQRAKAAEENEKSARKMWAEALKKEKGDIQKSDSQNLSKAFETLNILNQ